MKLELKHIVGYLPYRLQAKVDAGVWELKKIDLTGEKVVFVCYSNCRHEFNMGFSQEDFKPILRPMSDLHKDIDGKISIKELWVMGLFGYHLKDKDIHPDLLSEWELSDLMDNISFDNYEKLFDYLYQNHFDIHGLIEQGLAIDINTL